jgi:hypothetical protein
MVLAQAAVKRRSTVKVRQAAPIRGAEAQEVHDRALLPLERASGVIIWAVVPATRALTRAGLGRA